uniref:Uncharacterized protein n=1 Tax=Rhizophora mucronata TaxID=61149 RepID=A0A2P2P5D8_RHIMU
MQFRVESWGNTFLELTLTSPKYSECYM